MQKWLEIFRHYSRFISSQICSPWYFRKENWEASNLIHINSGTSEPTTFQSQIHYKCTRFNLFYIAAGSFQPELLDGKFSLSTFYTWFQIFLIKSKGLYAKQKQKIATIPPMILTPFGYTCSIWTNFHICNVHN